MPHSAIRNVTFGIIKLTQYSVVKVPRVRHGRPKMSRRRSAAADAPPPPRSPPGKSRRCCGALDLSTRIFRSILSVSACAVRVPVGTRGWWSRGGSNPRPPPCKGGALPIELRPPVLGGSRGSPPAVGSVNRAAPAACDLQRRKRGWRWWAILDSNQGPQSYQDCALTT